MARAEERIEVAGISISNPSRVLDPAGVTKLALARYYEAIGPRMLPHVKGRPLTLLRWAEGKPTEKGGVFLRHARVWGPKVLRRVAIREKTKVGEYLVVDDVAGLVALAQIDVLEIHTWSSRVDEVEKPDRLVFDLDPSPEIGWEALADAAREVRARLESLGLESWVRTTGGKGLHVVVPLAPAASWDVCFRFASAFALLMVHEAPTRYVAQIGARARTKKILIDYLRNNRANTAIESFSIRARPGAPVAMPIAWKDLARDLRAEPFTMASARKKRSDPWKDYWTTAQELPRVAT